MNRNGVIVNKRSRSVGQHTQPNDTTHADYCRDGFVVPRNQLDHAQIGTIRDDMARVFAHQMSACSLEPTSFADADGWRDNLCRLFDTDTNSYLAAARQCQMLPSVHALGTSPAVLSLLNEIGLSEPAISTKPVCHFMTDHLHIPGGYHKAPPHQDWRSMQGSLDGCVVWIPLSLTDENAYPVEVVPGSHKLGLLDTEPHVATPMVVDPRIRAEDYVPVLMKPGDLAAFSGFLVHRTSEQGDDRVRLAISFRYNNLAEPTFVEHRYPLTCPPKSGPRRMFESGAFLTLKEDEE